MVEEKEMKWNISLETDDDKQIKSLFEELRKYKNWFAAPIVEQPAGVKKIIRRKRTTEEQSPEKVVQ
jgi:hypothetical protein